MFDLDLITKNYQELSAKIEKAKKHCSELLSSQQTQTDDQQQSSETASS